MAARDPFKAAEKVLAGQGIIAGANGGNGEKRRRGVPRAENDKAGFTKAPAAAEGTPAAFDPRAVVERAGLYWLKGKDTYLRPAPGGEDWLPEPSKAVARLLRIHGVRSRNLESTHSEADEVFQYVHDYRHVAFAGPIAGRKAGVLKLPDGRSIIVTSSFPRIAPAKGEWPVLRAFFDALFITDECDQSQYVFAWLKVARAALAAGLTRPGPWLVLAGAHGSGKSLLQRDVLTPLIGRPADPRDWLLDKTQHNADVIGAEHLILDELPAKLDQESRSSLGERMKQVAVQPSQRWRGMHQDGFVVPVFWRGSLSMNDSVDVLKRLPPLSSGFEDKILLLWCKDRPKPMPTRTDQEWVAFGEAMKAELPAFAYFLDHEYEIPAEMKRTEQVGRYGFDGFHHPALRAMIFEQEPESNLLYMIDCVLFGGNGVRDFDGQSYSDAWGWERSEVLGDILRDHAKFGAQARQLLKFSNATGYYLNKLKGKFPHRFKSKHTNAGNVWLIPPASS